MNAKSKKKLCLRILFSQTRAINTALEEKIILYNKAKNIC